MKVVFFFLFMLTLGSLKAQNNKEFKNQGEQERYWTKKFFEEQYVKSKFSNYKGKITTIENRFIYGKRVLETVDISSALSMIFSNGLLNPSLFEVEFMMSKNDTLKISNLEELKFLSNTASSKRFRFTTFRKGFMNPTIYFIELSNRKAGLNTTLVDFIKGSKLTFFKTGWTQI